MFKFLRNFFQSIFGGNKGGGSSSGGTVTQPPLPKPKPEPEEPTQDPPKNLITLRLERSDSSRSDTLGKLLWEGEIVADTLEGPLGGPPRDEKALPAGKYPIVLRRIGGMHGTYSFRFKDFHQGMLWITEVPKRSFPFIKVGNTAEFAYGSILLGKDPQPAQGDTKLREVWHSEDTYKAVYNRLAQHLAAGNAAQLEIVDPA